MSIHKVAVIPSVNVTLNAKIQTNQSMYRGSFFLHLSSVESIFPKNISRKDDVNIITSEEDKQFLHMQQQDPSSSSMSWLDKSLSQQESRKRARVTRPLLEKKLIHGNCPTSRQDCLFHC